MPRVGGLALLDDRVFHVLVLSAHSTYTKERESSSSSSERRQQSCTVQLPIDFESFRNVDSVMQRSHVKLKGSSMRYQPSSEGSQEFVQAEGKKRGKPGQKLTEGNYVSLERVMEASKTWYINEQTSTTPTNADTECCHRWDMMTLSTAGGVTRLAPKRIQVNETLDAIAEDVHYVLKYIAEQRRSGKFPRSD